MTHEDDNARDGKAQSGSGGRDFDRRVEALRHRIEAPEEARGRAAEPGTRRADNSLARALRLSSEFVAGVIVGGAIGWAIDRVLGITPWGMIVFLLLGFGAGVLNVMRASGFLGAKGDGSGGR